MAALETCLRVDFSHEGARFAHRAAITDLLAPFCARHSVADFAAGFDSAGVT